MLLFPPELLLSEDAAVRDPERGWREMEAAAEGGNCAAEYTMGKRCLERNNRADAKEWLARSALQGSQQAQYLLGKLLLEEGNEPDAMGCFREAAFAGNDYAEYFQSRQESLAPPQVVLAATGLMKALARLFDEEAKKSAAPIQRMDRKRRMELLQKRESLGIRGPIEEKQYDNSYGMGYS